MSLLVALIPALAAAVCAAPAPASASATPSCTSSASWWKPTAGSTWNIALSTNPTVFSPNITVYDLDLFGTANSTIASMHAAGHKVICYYSAGSWENWRPDASKFPNSAKGNPLSGWQGERWLDTRDATVRALMKDRIALAKAKGCDGVDPDNIDGYLPDNDAGFPLTQATGVDYVNYLAATAHGMGLASGLKNGGQIVSRVLANVDWEVNEQCAQYQECDSYTAFIKANKPVFQLEYTDAQNKSQKTVTPAFAKRSCTAQGAAGFSTLLKHLDLAQNFTALCPNGATVPF